jgi:hypothetical protein
MPKLVLRNERAAAKGRAIERNRLIAAWCGGIHGLKHPIRTRPHDRPLVALQHDKCEPPARKVLLILEILICGDHHIESALLSGIDQLPVPQSIPTHL